MSRITPLLMLSLFACTSEWKAVDIDGDGLSAAEGDCWDSSLDPVPPEGAQDHGVKAGDISPDAEDLPYDGIDQNCDGLDDFDQDGDGLVPDVYIGVETLGVDGSGELEGGDCWDEPEAPALSEGAIDHGVTGADIFTGAGETHYDGIDQNCDGLDDFDQDLDGYVSDAFAGLSTVGADGSGGLPGGDCWDDPDKDPSSLGMDALNGLSQPEAADVNPQAFDQPYDGVNQDCGETAYEFDDDQDGYASQWWPDREGLSGLDCVDSVEDASYVSSAALEPSQINPGVASEEEIWYDGQDQNCAGDSDYDQDLDGHDSSAEPQLDGSIGPDCDDLSADVGPDAVEALADMLDQDCDGTELCYVDGDGDGHAGEDTDFAAAVDCSLAGFAISVTDCDDGDADAFPGAAAESPGECMKDSDGDGFGDAAAGGLVAAGSDCNDDSVLGASINPDAVELPADLLDQDCDGSELCFTDLDGDGYGSASTHPSQSLTCSDGAESLLDTDCDDSDSLVAPDLAVLETDSSLCMADHDGDGFGDSESGGLFQPGTDCDDGSPDSYPDAPETAADGVDQDCSGGDDCYVDSDGDSFGGSSLVSSETIDCTAVGESVLGTDCDDADVSAFPGAAGLELDGSLCMRDSDGDGYGDDSPVNSEVHAGTDCWDSGDAVLRGLRLH